ncbi:hypothetical protein PPNK14_31610 [Pectobacterium parmentieri]
MLEILTYWCTLRFLRAVRVQTGGTNNAYWNRLYITSGNAPDMRGVSRHRITRTYGRF